MRADLASSGAPWLVSGCLALGLALAPVGAQQDPPVPASVSSPQQPPDTPQTQAPTFRTGVNLVRVDVVATNREGRQVTDLTAEDFEVSDEGRRQPIAAFKLVSSDGQGDAADSRATSSDAVEAIDSSADDVRLFAVFLDDYSVTPRWSAVAREQVARFVERTLGPADLVAVMRPLTPLESVRLARNREAVGAAIRKFDGVRGVNSAAVDPRRGSLTTIRRDASFSALKALIERLGSLKEGRKTLMLVTEGYGNSTESLNRLKEMGDLASRNNTAIYPVFARVARPNYDEDISVDAEMLRTLAERSGGRVIFDGTRTFEELRSRAPETGLAQSRLAVAMQQIAVDASGYYLLGYPIADAKPDGQFHRISVRVKRPGVELRYRKGYLSVKPEEAPRPATTAAPATPLERTRAFETATRDRMVLTWIGQARGTDGKTRVTIAWDPRPPDSGSAQPNPVNPANVADRPARLMLKASGPNAVTYFEGRTPDASTTGGAHATFDAAPGPMQLRFSVENSAGIVLDSELHNVEVADLSKTVTFMSTPALYRARSASEWRQLSSNADASPTAVRDFNRSDHLLIRVTAYATTGRPGEMVATLLNRAGQSLSVLQVLESKATGAPEGLREVDLPLQNLARGEYGVRLTTTTESGSTMETVAFRVN